MSDLTAPSAFELARRAPSQRTAGLISGMTGYRETARGRFFQRETASLVVPLIISFGTPFLIALGREPDAADRQPSFAAGLYAGPVLIESDGGAECVQVDFTPLGAYRFFGGTVVDLAARMVDMSDVLGREGRATARTAWRYARLAEPLRSGRGFCRRSRQPPAVARDRIRLSTIGAQRRAARGSPRSRKRSAGAASIWSNRFRSELGLAPKPVARMMRFHRACRLAQRDEAARLGRDCGRERLCRPGASRPRIFNPCRRIANGLGPAAGADRQPPDAPAGRLVWPGNKSSSPRCRACA